MDQLLATTENQLHSNEVANKAMGNTMPKAGKPSKQTGAPSINTGNKKQLKATSNTRESSTETSNNLDPVQVTGTGTTIEDFTKNFLLQNVPLNEVSDNLFVPNFPTPISNEKVGGKLRHYVSNWEMITNDSFCLNVVKNGYKPILKHKPPLVRNPQPYEYDLSEEHLNALDVEVNNFLSNDVIEPVHDLNSQGFYSCLFVRPRSNDSPNRWRCIFDISELNKYLVAPRFKMESPNSIRKLLKLNYYCLKLDLSDAFLHVPLHPSFRKYMRFFHRGIAYQFKTICFGANFSPYIFSYLINVVMKFFHKCNIEIAAYLDDMYSQHPVPVTLKSHILFVSEILTFLGWTVNFEKSIFNPLQIMDYIGLHINLRTGLVHPP